MGKPRRGKEGARRNYSAYNSTNYLISPTQNPREAGSPAEDDELDGDHEAGDGREESPAVPNKHALYQRAVQRPKGDISYLHKFFLNYVGGRTPLHLREDFCGTALICAEWVRGDPRRTAVGLDLDEDSLSWGLQHNVLTAGSDAYRRVHLFCGDVLNPLPNARAMRANPPSFSRLGLDEEGEEGRIGDDGTGISGEGQSLDSTKNLPKADLICAFNYSCCCLQRRVDLVKYFSLALAEISRDGGIFAMDLYGGVSSECSLKLRRRFEEFDYTWEQGEFNVISRTTRISLHFRLKENQGVLRHAFSYHWRLWTLPEVKECLEEAGFLSVHFWIREMPDLQTWGREESEEPDMQSEYEEMATFLQADAWNAYVVAVAPPRPE